MRETQTFEQESAFQRCHMLTSGFIGFVTAVCGIHSEVPAIDLMPTKVAYGTLSCFHVIVFTEAKSFLSSSLPVCD